MFSKGGFFLWNSSGVSCLFSKSYRNLTSYQSSFLSPTNILGKNHVIFLAQNSYLGCNFMSKSFLLVTKLVIYVTKKDLTPFPQERSIEQKDEWCWFLKRQQKDWNALSSPTAGVSHNHKTKRATI